MAKSAVIGALRVNLGIDSAQFQKGLKNAQSGLDQFARVVKSGLIAVSSAATAAAAALAVGVKGAIDNADDMSKAAQRFGVTVEELTRLKYAADLSGVSFENMGTGLRKLSQSMQQFAAGAKNEASRSFEALGISVTNADGTLKQTSVVLSEVAAKFATMQDGAQKTAIAMAIFGRSGTDLIPMLNQGADGIAQMTAEADRLGLTIDTSTAQAAERFNDTLTRIGTANASLKNSIAAELLPALERLAEAFFDFTQNAEAVEAIASAIGDVFSFVTREAFRLAGGVKAIQAEIAGLINAGKALGNLDLAGARDAWNAGQEEARAIIEEYSKMGEAIVDGVADGVDSRFTQGQIQSRIDAAFGTAGAKAGETFVASFEGASGGGGGGAGRGISKIAQEAARIFEQTRTPLEQYHAQIARLNELLSLGAINQDTYNRAVTQAQDAFDKASEGAEENLFSLEKVGQTIAGTVTSAFQGLIDGSKKLKDVLKDLLSQLASMAINSAFKAIIGGVFGGGGGLLGSILGFRANGGPISAGNPYVVGERGPELIVPNTSGSVVSNREMRGLSSRLRVTVATDVDKSGNLLPFVTSVAREESAATTGKLARNVPGMVDRRNDIRNIRKTRA